MQRVLHVIPSPGFLGTQNSEYLVGRQIGDSAFAFLSRNWSLKVQLLPFGSLESDVAVITSTRCSPAFSVTRFIIEVAPCKGNFCCRLVQEKSENDGSYIL